MTDTAPRLHVMLAQPLWMYNDIEKRFMSSLLLVCDRIICLDLHKHCFDPEHVDKARGFFASFGSKIWCKAAWEEHLLEEPEGVDELVRGCRDALYEQAMRTGTCASPTNPQWCVNPEELVSKAYLALSERDCTPGRQVYPAALSAAAPQPSPLANSAIAAHYYLARAAVTVALPSLPAYDDSERVIAIRRQCLQSGELEEFQTLIRKLTVDVNAALLASDASPDLDRWAAMVAENRIRPALDDLVKKIRGLKSHRSGAMQDGEFLSPLVSLIAPASWVEFFKSLVVGLPAISEAVATMIDPEKAILKRNPSLAYLYRLSMAA